MKEKIKSHFDLYPPRYFVATCVIFLLITDLINCKFLQIYWTTRNFSKNIVAQTISKTGQLVEDFSLSTINEMTGFVDKSFYFLLFVIIVNNLFFYFFYLKRKLWAQSFVLFYVFTGALLQFSFILDHHGINTFWLIYNFLLIPLYLYFFLGIKILKNDITEKN
jgi:hypothetical protein